MGNQSVGSLDFEVGGISLVLIYGAAFVAALANPLTKRRMEAARIFCRRAGASALHVGVCLLACRLGGCFVTPFDRRLDARINQSEA